MVWWLGRPQHTLEAHETPSVELPPFSRRGAVLGLFRVAMELGRWYTRTMDEKLRVRYLKWNGTKLRYVYNLANREVWAPGLEPFIAVCWEDAAWEVREKLAVAEGVAGADAMPETELYSAADLAELEHRVGVYAKLMEQHAQDRELGLLGWAAFSWRLAQRKVERAKGQ